MNQQQAPAYPGAPVFPASMPPFGVQPAFPISAPPGSVAARPPMMMPPVQMAPLLRPLGTPTIVLPKTGNLAPLPSPLLAKSTTLYVGKIAPTVDDATIKALLEACGAVRSWKRVTDPETQAPKGFGFCEYEDAEGVLRAIRLLHNLSLDGQELLLKCNSTTQKYVDEYKARKAPSTAPEEERDNAAMEAVMTIVSDRASAAKPPDAIDSFLSSVKEERSHEKEERPRERDRDRGRRGERESLESSLHRERERERAAEQARAAEYERRYNKLLVEWEAHERDWRSKVEQDRERDKDVARERARQMRSDLEADASDSEDEPWRRRTFRQSRKAEERKRRREREEREDAADEEAEAAERPAKQAREENGLAHPAEEAAARPNVDPDDPIYRAMLSASKSTTAPIIPAPLAPAAARAPPVRRKPIVNAFGAEEDEMQPRKLKTLEYTEEEKRAMAEAASRKAVDPKDAVKQLIDTMPSTPEAVFAYSVNWAAFDDGGGEIAAKVSTWVARKTKELLGEEEASMVDFVMGQLRSHSQAQKVLSELEAVLDDEAAAFVFKLYRMVIFETEKYAQLGSVDS